MVIISFFNYDGLLILIVFRIHTFIQQLQISIQMKPFFIASIIILNISLSVTKAQNNPKPSKVAEITFKVSGVCNMCKERIEEALEVNGVKLAEWDKHTQMVKVVYVPTKIEVSNLHKLVADVGHDTDQVKAPKAVYDKLPACCKYHDVKSH